MLAQQLQRQRYAQIILTCTRRFLAPFSGETRSSAKTGSGQTSRKTSQCKRGVLASAGACEAMPLEMTADNLQMTAAAAFASARKPHAFVHVYHVCPEPVLANHLFS
jgi:hypothetical protein